MVSSAVCKKGAEQEREGDYTHMKVDQMING